MALQKTYNANPSDELRIQLDATKTALDNILTSEAEKSLLFCKQRMYEYGNKPSRYLANQEREKLNCPIALEELLRAISELSNNKAPGPHGLIAEFFKEFKGCLKEPLLAVLVQSFEDGTLPSSATEACISLIHKKGRPANECSSFRPISLLNLDRKILAKILAKHVEAVAPQLVQTRQGSSRDVTPEGSRVHLA